MYQAAFDNIKQIVVSRECLTVIDHAKLNTNKIFVTTNASDQCTGAVLSFGPTWEPNRPVTFNSSIMKDAELNYPVHEKEMLAIICAMNKWKYDLIGSSFFVYTNHKTLLKISTQKDLSCRQACWMEALSMYNCKFVYVKGEHNMVADALSRYPSTQTSSDTVAQQSVQHPHIGFDPSSIIILNCPKSSPLTCVAALTDTNPQLTKLEFSINDDMIHNSSLPPMECQIFISRTDFGS